MAIKTRIQTVDRDIEILLREDLSPAAQSLAFASFAREQIDTAGKVNARILGRIPRSKTFVDGREGAELETVNPKGVIVTEFELVDDTLKWIADQLETHSPVKTGRYKKSHTLLADGAEIDVGGVIPAADEYVFINTVPYARKLERGMSSQAPDGVYQVVAVLAQRRFGNIAKVTFSFRTVLKGHIVGGRAGDRAEERNPAIIVRTKS